MKYYPLFMNLEGRECLVVGAGAVAARKARSLLECGAKVTVIGENPVPSLRRLEGERLRIRPRKFRSKDMQKLRPRLRGHRRRRRQQRALP